MEFIVIERSTGWSRLDEPRRDHNFGPFPAPVVADLWIEKRKKEIARLAAVTGTSARLHRNPNIYFVEPLHEPNW